MLKLIKKILAAIVIVCAVTPFFGLLLSMGDIHTTFYSIIEKGLIFDALIICLAACVFVVKYCVKIIAD